MNVWTIITQQDLKKIILLRHLSQIGVKSSRA